MSNILIINAGAQYFHSQGALNTSLAELAKNTLQEIGHTVQLTHITEGYEISAEIDKYLWADVIIYQQPAWWMGTPWMLKKYIDEVFTHGQGKLYSSDGRSRLDPNKHYGSGGLLDGKYYMISCTWNAPEESFHVPTQFFEGKGVDAVYFPFHKLNQFLALTPLPTFSCHDVIKEGDIEKDMKRYTEHLKTYIV